MAKRKKKRGWLGLGFLYGLWSALGDGAKRGLLLIAAGLSLFMVMGLGAAVGINRLEASVYSSIRDKYPEASWELVNWPEGLPESARVDIGDAIAPALDADWTDERVCKLLADRLSVSGWIERVEFVRRTSDAHFQIQCEYRQPFAMVQQGDEFYWIDRVGVRLPGVYLYDPRWPFIQGVRRPAPAPGQSWPGRDLRAGLETLMALEPEPFQHQITAVLVNNYAGRADARLSHVELATDRMGGRILWGSAPGEEVEENSVAKKVAILRENYRQTGRIDADHQVIDISTFANSFTVPG